MKIKSLEIMQNLEMNCIAWAVQYLEAHVGDIITYKAGKVTKQAEITHIHVNIGRNAIKTIKNSLFITYIGRRIRKRGGYVDAVGHGIVLDEFTLADGTEVTKHQDWECSTTIKMSFTVEVDRELKKLFPDAFRGYRELTSYPYTR